MNIRKIFETKQNPVLSFEVFPPKKDSGTENVKAAVEAMAKLPVDYMSVTYGAGGSTSKNTAEIASHMQDQLNMTALAHLTCVGATRAQISQALDGLSARGIHNILALRGDIPEGSPFPLRDGYRYASELTEDICRREQFCVGGACYPEGHPDADGLDADIEHLKRKIDAGCQFLVTQMFFDNDTFYRFRDKAAAKGIHVPITAGIMPLTNAAQIQRMCVLSGGVAMPMKFTRMIAKYIDHPQALRQAGIAYATDQIIDLLSNDTAGIHLYTMNKPEVAEKIVSAITSLFQD